MINPSRLSWQAPTENEDGTPIDYELVYHLGVEDPLDGSFEVVAEFPGDLNPDGTYQTDLSQFSFGDGQHTIALRAVRADLPTLVSAWSNAITFEVENDTPNPPMNLALS
jgi:hypothetical protein